MTEPGNGGTILYRVGRLEAQHERLQEQVAEVVRAVDRHCSGSERVMDRLAADVHALDVRQDVQEGRLTDLRIEFAKWGAFGGLLGGVIAQLVAAVVRAWAP